MANSMLKNPSEEIVLHQLHELFGSILNLDVIKTVAVSCEYDVHKSSNKLIEMTTHSVNGGKITKIHQEPVVEKKSKKASDIERAIHYIDKGYKVLIIMRGLPGSGKTYLATQILLSTLGNDVNMKQHILSSDDYFRRNPQGIYRYDPRFIEEAHNYNQQRAFESMSKGYSPVIIDNTNTQMWEMKPYATMATDYGYIIEILEPDTHWCFNDKELAKRNQHGVHKTKINDMLGRYERNVIPQKLLLAYNLSYRLQKPPQLRLYPPPNLSQNKVSQIKNYPNASFGYKNYKCDQPTYSFLGNSQNDQNCKVIDTIDLMDFNDDNFPTHTSGTVQNKTQIGTAVADNTNVSGYSSLFSVCDGSISNSNEVKTKNSVDEILMFSNDSNPSTNTGILLPQNNRMEIVNVDSSDEDNTKATDIESSWGVNEEYLKSWDIVTPLENVGISVSPVQCEEIAKPETKDVSCFTDDNVFNLLQNRGTNEEQLKIIQSVNRDINRYTLVSPKKQPIPKKVMLDKSCMTEDICEDYENHMSELLNLFPTIPKSHLNYWYRKCKGDIEWTIEFLLEAKDELDTLQEDDITLEDTDNKSNASESNQLETKQSTPSTSLVSKSKKFRKSVDQDNELKKLIESRVDIDDKYYSKHVLKVKNFKFNKNQSESEATLKNSESNEHSTDSSSSSESKSSNPVEDDVVIIEDSDVEFDDIDLGDPEKPEASTENTIELNLGDSFVSQLEKEFGDPSVLYPQGFQPVVQVPMSLARQLYAFYMESVYQQMENQRIILETLTKEDEDFAKKLQAKENEALVFQQTPPTVNFKEIMDEQVAQTIYEKETALWKNLDPDNLAARLTRQKLFSIFPNIDEGTLVEILHAHGNKYADTVESLLVSTGMINIVKNIEALKEPPIRDAVLEEMKEAKNNNVIGEYEEQREATFYREEANKFLKKRADLYQKAQMHHQRGMNEVAQFYSILASQQTQYYETANSLAATAFLDEHSHRLKDFNTLDLHFLYVKEAIPALDLFLDRNINLLRHSKTKQSECLQIITGRGNRSENNVPKIKPAIQARLQARKIRFQQLNPGLLKIKVTKNSPVTSELSS